MGFNLSYQCLFCCWNAHIWPLGVPLDWRRWPFNMHSLSAAPTSILSAPRLCRLIWLFPFYSPEPVISYRSPGSFRWRMVLEATICALGALIASRVQLLLGCFKREQENISKCIFKHICTYFFICMYSKNHKLILISSILILQYKIYSSFSPFFTFSSFYP